MGLDIDQYIVAASIFSIVSLESVAILDRAASVGSVCSGANIANVDNVFLFILSLV